MDWDDKTNEYIFWQNQFSDCTSLKSADIIFRLSNGGIYHNIDGLFAGCSNLSYIRVRDVVQAFLGSFVSNNWLVADDLPDDGTLIVPAVVDNREDKSKPFTLDDINYFDNMFLNISIFRRLLEKGWTIKSE